MAKTKIMPGEMFIVEYVNGGLVNRWAINDSKEYITLGVGRKAAAGFTDVLVGEPGKALIDARYHITDNLSAVKFISDVPLGTQSFAQIPLYVFKVLKETQIFDRYANSLGTIPANSLIGTESGLAGTSNRHLMLANAYNPQDGSGWKFVNQSTYSYGFVNVQLGNGLQKYDPNKNLETLINSTPANIDWELVAQVIDTEASELVLRDGDLTLLTKEEIIENVNDYFAKISLEEAELMDPIAFFGNVKNKEFVERMLEEVNPVKAAEFTLNADEFNL